MADAVIKLAKGLVFLVVAATAIICLYAAIDAMAIYSNHTVFVSGLAVVFIGILVGPLFCFIAGYGMIYDLDVPVWQALILTMPVLLAWCFVAARWLSGLVASR